MNVNAKLEIALGFRVNDPNGVVTLQVTDQMSGIAVTEVQLSPRQFRDLLAGTYLTGVDGWLLAENVRARLGRPMIYGTVTAPTDLPRIPHGWNGRTDALPDEVRAWITEQVRAADAHDWSVKRATHHSENPGAAILHWRRWPSGVETHVESGDADL